VIVDHQKTIPNDDRRLARNIQSLINEVKQIHKIKPNIINLLIYFYNSVNNEVTSADESFKLVTIDYSKVLQGQFVLLR
jgi:hypothetical protein